MGRIGHGYGSEWHLLRYLGRQIYSIKPSRKWLGELVGGKEVRVEFEN
jgi:hypothetical protein